MICEHCNSTLSNINNLKRHQRENCKELKKQSDIKNEHYISYQKKNISNKIINNLQNELQIQKNDHNIKYNNFERELSGMKDTNSWLIDEFKNIKIKLIDQKEINQWLLEELINVNKKLSHLNGDKKFQLIENTEIKKIEIKKIEKKEEIANVKENIIQSDDPIIEQKEIEIIDDQNNQTEIDNNIPSYKIDLSEDKINETFDNIVLKDNIETFVDILFDKLILDKERGLGLMCIDQNKKIFIWRNDKNEIIEDINACQFTTTLLNNNGQLILDDILKKQLKEIENSTEMKTLKKKKLTKKIEELKNPLLKKQLDLLFKNKTEETYCDKLAELTYVGQIQQTEKKSVEDYSISEDFNSKTKKRIREEQEKRNNEAKEKLRKNKEETKKNTFFGDSSLQEICKSCRKLEQNCKCDKNIY